MQKRPSLEDLHQYPIVKLYPHVAEVDITVKFCVVPVGQTKLETGTEINNLAFSLRDEFEKLIVDYVRKYPFGTNVNGEKFISTPFCSHSLGHVTEIIEGETRFVNTITVKIKGSAAQREKGEEHTFYDDKGTVYGT